MANTTVATNDALTQKIWEKDLFEDTKKASYFSKFMGGMTSVVYEKNQLEKTQGDNITFGIRNRLVSDGKTSVDTVEGNELALSTNSFSVSLEEYAEGVRDRGPLDRKRPIWDVDNESRQALLDWGSEKMDQLCFDNLYSAALTRVFYNGLSTATEATATAAVEATNTFSFSNLMKAKAWLKTGGNRAQVPLRPIKVGSQEYFIVLVHPDVMADVEQNAELNQAQREAEVRGKENPIFSGASAIYRGFIIHEHENVPITTTWGAGGAVTGAKNVILGQQALCWAWGARPKITPAEFDYGRSHGYCWSMMAGLGKTKFNSKDYGVAGFYTARSAISDAA